MPQPAQKPGEPMQHQRVPGAVLNRKYPPLETRVQAMLPILAGMPETFWTDAFVSAARAAGASGFASTSGMSNAQEMLDWLGWRVVESRKNRNGYSYRWVKDPNAVVGVGSDTSTRAARGNAARGGSNVTDIRPKETPSLGDLVDESMAALQETAAARQPKQEPAATVLAADAGPIAAAFAEAERKKAEHKLKYERVTCPTCQRTFTPDGYGHHIEATQHGENKPVLTTTATVTIADLTPAEQEHVATIAEPDRPKVPVIQQGDYDAMESMATEAEARAVAAEAEADAVRKALATMRLAAEVETSRAADLDAKLLDANEALERAEEARADAALQRSVYAARVKELEVEKQEMDDARLRLMQELIDLQDEAQHRGADDGSWLIDVDQVRGVPIDTIVQNASVLGVTVELRGRRS